MPCIETGHYIKKGVLDLHNRKEFIRYSYLFLVPALLIYAIFTIIPNILGLFLGFTNWSVYKMYDFTFVGLDNFKQILTESNVRISILNTLYFTVFTVFFKNIFGLICALIVDKNLKSRIYLRTVIFMPLIISPIVIAVIFSAIYEPDKGLLNTFLRYIGLGIFTQGWLTDTKVAMTSICIMDVWSGIGFSMVIFLAALQGVPKEYLEASMIDGAKGMQRLKHVILPLIMQSVSVNVLFSVVSSLKVFTQVYALTNGGPADSTQVVQTFIYKAFSGGRYGYASAVGIVSTIVISIISFAVLKLFGKREVEY